MAQINFNSTSFKVAPEVKVRAVDAVWSVKDYLGALMVRLSVNRNKYTVRPGLYKLGDPNNESNVFVSANYKLSFDVLRRDLKGLSCWILVLDTKGINVWCAAGKGTFGSAELIGKINETALKNRVNHKRIIVPMLGAPGISAHRVKAETGFNIKYGPAHSNKILDFIDNNYRTSSDMRKVRFNWWDRAKLIPVEWAFSLKYLVYALLVLLVIGGVGYLFGHRVDILKSSISSSILLFGAFVAGTSLGPLLLPILPFRSFSLKGVSVGVLAWIVAFPLSSNAMSLASIAWLLLYISIASFFVMNFTGSTTFTSLSGVKKEMKIAVPAQIVVASVGFVFLIVSKFVE